MTWTNTPTRPQPEPRERPLKATPGTRSQQGDVTAIYCRKSRKGDKEQITVGRQKKLALQDCEKLGLHVSGQHIYIDNGESAWRHNRKRKGWDALIDAARRGEITHIMCYHPDRLMRQPHDLEELLSISDGHGILLYGRVNRRDLQDPDDRYALRIEVAHACRSSDDTSRRLKDERQERAENGLPSPGGRRRYGYTPDGKHLIPNEATIVREIFKCYVNGEGSSIIARHLNERGVKTAQGRAWTGNTVRGILGSRYVTGIRVHRGDEAGNGNWPVIIKRPLWKLAQEMREFRVAKNEPTAIQADAQTDSRPHRTQRTQNRRPPREGARGAHRQRRQSQMGEVASREKECDHTANLLRHHRTPMRAKSASSIMHESTSKKTHSDKPDSHRLKGRDSSPV
jgi:site-specific DNA recombinase